MYPWIVVDLPGAALGPCIMVRGFNSWQKDILPVTWLDSWKQRARQLKTEVYALYLAYRDPRVSWPARIFAACVVAYAFSPIDLIPDPIPVLGYLDDLVLIPLGIALARRMIPAEVLEECRERARMEIATKPVNRVAAAVIVAIWLLLAALAVVFLLDRFS
ncbi:MAG TPA: YkvA family protein [Chloroflexia bacterium]|jgi:uncharacterized membrane protein YkvA (DUF1232 family)